MPTKPKAPIDTPDLDSTFGVPENRSLKGVQCSACGKANLSFDQKTVGVVEAKCGDCEKTRKLRLRDFYWLPDEVNS